MLKGRTKIELTDVNTGTVQTVEEDNLVTNAFADLCKPVCEIGPLPLHAIVGSGRVCETAFGGIMLFDSALNEDPADYLIPADVEVTGYAEYNTVYNDVNTQKGSFNKPESGLQEDGSYQFVYDFATNQANGVIGSVCLVPAGAASLGFGTKIYDGITNKGYINDTYVGSTLYGKYLERSNYSFLFTEENMIYGVYFDSELSKGIMKIDSYHFYNSIGITDIPNGEQKKIETLSVKIPETADTGGNYAFLGGYYENGVFTMFLTAGGINVSVKNGEDIFYYRFDVKNGFSAKRYSVRNTTGEDIYLKMSYAVSFIHSNYLAVKGYSGDYYLISLKDATDCRKLLFEDGTPFKGAGNYAHILNGVTEEYGVLIANYNVHIVNFKKATVFQIQGGGFTGSERNYGYHFCYNNMIKYFLYNNGGKMFIRQTINPYLLMTKNNLSTPILKTASQSMKITYTLSETAEA